MSVQKRERNGKVSYRVQWRADGLLKSKTFPREREALRYEREVRRDLDRGSYIDPHERVTVGEYAAEYLGTRGHSESSRKVYAAYLRRVNESGLGARPLGKVRPSEITGWVSRLEDDGLAPRTVALMVSWLRSVYAAAVEDERVAKSPVPSARKLALAQGDDEPVDVPSVEEVDRFADGMERLEPRCRMMIIAQAGIGLRVGEMLALRVQDFDRDRHEVWVCGRVLQGTRERVPGTKGTRGQRIKTRTVPLLPDVAEELAEHMLIYSPRADGALFYDAKGQLYSHAAYEWRFLRARDWAGLGTEITAHKLRYHFASVALAKGVPIKDVATFLGHSDTRLVERVYGHVMGDAGARFIETMGRTWGQRERSDVAPRVARWRV